MRALAGCVTLGVLAGTLAALAACGQKSETRTAAPAAASERAAAPAAPAAAAAPAWPKRKPGLWVQTMNLKAQGFSRSFRFCVDESSDQKMGLNSQGADTQCRQTSMTRGLDGSWTIVSACDMGAAGKTDSTVHVSGDFNTRYVMDITSTTTGAAQPALNGEHKMSMTAEWSGACPAGWTGGDVEMPGGRRINLMTKAVSGG
uniref:DUF3617 family protein n=1 Tax=Caulobacter sp. (strain K31) TaxID=366602 RepID=B0SWD3_CAUSK